MFRRNAIMLPICQLILPFVFFVGFAAVLQVPGPKGADTNLALFKLVEQQFPLRDLNVGIVALAANLLVAAAFSATTRPVAAPGLAE